MSNISGVTSNACVNDSYPASFPPNSNDNLCALAHQIIFDVPVSIFPALPQITEISTRPRHRRRPTSGPSVWLLTGGAANALVCRKSGGKFGRSDGRLVACTEEAGRASRGHTCTHAHSRQTCSFLSALFSHPFPSLSKISISLISPNAGATKFRRRLPPPYFRAKSGTELFLFFRLSHAALPTPMHCKQSSSEEDRPRSPGGFLCHCAPKRFKIDGRISLCLSASL